MTGGDKHHHINWLIFFSFHLWVHIRKDVHWIRVELFVEAIKTDLRPLITKLVLHCFEKVFELCFFFRKFKWLYTPAGTVYVIPQQHDVQSLSVFVSSTHSRVTLSQFSYFTYHTVDICVGLVRNHHVLFVIALFIGLFTPLFFQLSVIQILLRVVQFIIIIV